MSRVLEPSNRGQAAASKRVQKSTATLTSVGATGVYTTTAAFLNDLQPGDVVVFSGLTGGSGIVAGKDYYLCPPRFASGATTLQISNDLTLVPLTGGTNITAGTLTTGRLTNADDGVLSGTIVGQDSVAGR